MSMVGGLRTPHNAIELKFYRCVESPQYRFLVWRLRDGKLIDAATLQETTIPDGFRFESSIPVHFAERIQ